jgi:uncharacterized C2H2 Zn-finger protein
VAEIKKAERVSVLKCPHCGGLIELGEGEEGASEGESPLKCDQCDYVAKSERGLALHKGKKHK